MGSENWRPSPRSLSFADIAHHLLHADAWLWRKIESPALEKMSAQSHEAGVVDAAAFAGLIDRLEASGRERATRLARLSQAQLESLIPDDRFEGEVSIWWVAVRGNLDHEAHHRGQLATLLRILEDQVQ